MPDATLKPMRWYLPNRRWLRFSLRAFLLFVLVLSLPLGWVGAKLANQRAEDRLAETIEASGGSVIWGGVSYGDPFGDIPTTWYSDILGPLGILDDRFFHRIDLAVQTDPVELARILNGVKRFGGRLPTLTMEDSELSDADLRGIDRLKQLEALGLMGCCTTDEGLRHIARLPSLKVLYLDFSDISDAGLLELAALPKIEVLRIAGTRITEEGLAGFRERRPDVVVVGQIGLDAKTIATIRELRKRNWNVALGESVRTSPNTLIRLEAGDRDKMPSEEEQILLRNIPRIWVTIRESQPRHLHEFFATVVQLEAVESDEGLTDDELRRFAACKRLKVLVVADDLLTDDGLAVLEQMPALECLHLRSGNVSPRGLEHVAACRTLKELTLCHNEFAAGNMAPLRALTQLELLDLFYANFLPCATIDLATLTTLRKLELQHSNFDDELLAPLVGLRNLETIKLHWTQISDAGLLRLAELPKLKELKCLPLGRITPAGIARFRELRPDVEVNCE